MKFDHTVSNTFKACGITEEEVRATLIELLAKLMKSTTTALSQKERIAVLIAALNNDSSILALILSDLTGIDFSTKSRVLEYLNNNLSDTAITSIFARVAATLAKETHEIQ